VEQYLNKIYYVRLYFCERERLRRIGWDSRS